MPRFSVLTPTRDRPQWLVRSIESVLAQTCPDFELIVYDNGTAHGSLPDDPRVRYLRGPADGPADAFQRTLELATGEIVHPLSDDDRLSPDALATVAQELGEHEWLVGRTTIEDERENVLYLMGGPIDLARLATEYYLGGAVYWRRALSDRVGGFDAAFDGAADYDLYLRFAAAAAPKFVDRVLYRYTAHASTDSKVRTANQLEKIARIQERARDMLQQPAAASLSEDAPCL